MQVSCGICFRSMVFDVVRLKQTNANVSYYRNVCMGILVRHVRKAQLATYGSVKQRLFQHKARSALPARTEWQIFWPSGANWAFRTCLSKLFYAYISA